MKSVYNKGLLIGFFLGVFLILMADSMSFYHNQGGIAFASVGFGAFFAMMFALYPKE